MSFAQVEMEVVRHGEATGAINHKYQDIQLDAVKKQIGEILISLTYICANLDISLVKCYEETQKDL